MINADGNELLDDDHTPIGGVSLSVDDLALVAERFPKKAYCLIEQWTLFQVDVSTDDLSKIHAVDIYRWWSLPIE
jgi:hypothetical protein